MKWILWLALLSGLFFTFSCKKSDPELESNRIRIDPDREIDALNKSLQLKGHYYDGAMPVQTTTGPILFNLVVPQDTIETGEQTSIFIPFFIPDQGRFTLCGTNVQVVGAKGYWRVAAVNDTGSGDYFLELAIPSLVREGNVRLRMNAELCISLNGQSLRVVTQPVEVLLTIRPALNCGDTLQGATGLTITKFYMGDKKGKVRLKLSTGAVGDRMDVRFGGRYILSTCGPLLRPSQYPKCSSPAECFPTTGAYQFRDYTFDYDPAISKFVEVYTLGFCSQPQTVWIVRMGCPE